MNFKRGYLLLICLMTLLPSMASASQVIWAKGYNDGDGWNVPVAVAVDSGGNAIVTGSVIRPMSTDITTVKYDGATGTILWLHHFDGGLDDRAVDVKVDGNDDVFVTGRSWEGPQQGDDYLTIKYDGQTGKALWLRRSNFSLSDIPTALAVDSLGNVLVTGRVQTNTAISYYYETVKMDGATGRVLWTNRDYRAGVPYGIAIDKANNVIVTGGSDGYGATHGDYVTLKYDGKTGGMLWKADYNGPSNGFEYASSLAVDSHGDVLVTGGAYTGTANGYDYTTLKYNGATGAILWLRRSNDTAGGNAFATAVKVDSHDNVVITGYAWGGTTDNDMATFKYDGATGATLWARHYNSPLNGDDRAYTLAIDSADNVIVAGQRYNGPTLGYDFIIVKYAGDTGRQLGFKTYNGLGNGDDVVTAIALDRSDNIFVTGSSYGGSTISQEYLTIKYTP